MPLTLHQMLFIVGTILISLTIHEYAHGYMAWYYGDSTAKDQGRLTLNPLKHLDLFGTAVFLLTTKMGVPFGWAKAIPINPSNLANPRKDMLKVALAGPAANLFAALFFLIFFGILNATLGTNAQLQRYQLLLILINGGLGLFNLLPVFPLDGEKVLLGLLPLETAIKVKNASDTIARFFWASALAILIITIIL